MTATELWPSPPTAAPADLVHCQCCQRPPEQDATLCSSPGGDLVDGDTQVDITCVVCLEQVFELACGVPCPVSGQTCPVLCDHHHPYTGG